MPPLNINKSNHTPKYPIARRLNNPPPERLFIGGCRYKAWNAGIFSASVQRGC